MKNEEKKKGLFGGLLGGKIIKERAVVIWNQKKFKNML